jgi:hypothetical protein
MTNKNKTNKQNTKQRKKNSRNLEKKTHVLLDEVCWCCSKFLHLHKRVGKEYQLTRQNSKAMKQQWGGGGGMRYLKKMSSNGE